MNNIMKFSESTISKKPEADIKTRIKASVVLFSIISEVCQNELKVKSNTRPISTFPTSANSSRRIFSEKYEETPSVKNNPNFKKIVNNVNKIPTNETYFFTYIGVEIVIVQNNNTMTVKSNASVGAMTM